MRPQIFAQSRIHTTTHLPCTLSRPHPEAILTKKKSAQKYSGITGPGGLLMCIMHSYKLVLMRSSKPPVARWVGGWVLVAWHIRKFAARPIGDAPSVRPVRRSLVMSVARSGSNKKSRGAVAVKRTSGAACVRGHGANCT